jgi:hypothetical protein
MTRTFWSLGLVIVVACTQPAPSGSSLLLDLSPGTRPAVVGAYDFELLGSGTGRACATRDDATRYWVGLPELDRISRDPLTRQAIAAAAFDAITRLEDVDSIVVTRVTTEAKGPDQVCASIVGRGVRLRKAGSASEPTVTPPAAPDDDDGSGSGGLLGNPFDQRS